MGSLHNPHDRRRRRAPRRTVSDERAKIHINFDAPAVLRKRHQSRVSASIVHERANFMRAINEGIDSQLAG
jgi:hypothetical protein